MASYCFLLTFPRWGDAARRCVARLLRVEIGVDEDELVRWRGPEQGECGMRSAECGIRDGPHSQFKQRPRA